MKRSKYGVDQSATGKLERTVDGIVFDSRREAFHYRSLKIAAQAGAISNLELQPRFLIQEKFTDEAGKKHRAIWYVADFRFKQGEVDKVVDVKSKPTQTAQFRLKWKLAIAKHLGITWEMWP